MILHRVVVFFKQTYLYLLLAIIVTTLLTWFNFNAQLIIALLFLRLVESLLEKRFFLAFGNSFMLSCLLIFLFKGIGLLYTDDLNYGWYLFQKTATLAAIPFILCSGNFTDGQGRRKIMTAYCLILFAISFYCLAANAVQYQSQHNMSIFFYHALVTPISQNAVFFSVFTCFALLFLMSSKLAGFDQKPLWEKPIRILLVVYFVGFTILLASKLMLVILFFMLLAFVNRKMLPIALAVFAILLVLVAVTNNPIRKRYLDIAERPIKSETISPGTYFNGVQLRILQWKFASQILHENHAWLWGVSPGDAQHKLDKKYADANMYLGHPGSTDNGFLNYNFHNQYLEELVQSGIAGLLLLLFSCYALVRIAIRVCTTEAIFTVVILLAIFFTESSLQMQDGLFLYTFFPCMLLFIGKKESNPSEAPAIS
jgi:O-antigen ligase